MIELKLLETIEAQKQLIDKLNDTICHLVNENAEQENMINELMKSHL